MLTLGPKVTCLPHFGQNKKFSQKKSPLLFSVYWILTSCKKSEKSNKPILRKRHYRWTGVQKVSKKSIVQKVLVKLWSILWVIPIKMVNFINIEGSRAFNFTKSTYLKACILYLLYFTKRKHFKNYEKWFLFHLKISFCSKDIYFFWFFSFLSTASRFKGQMKME